MKIKESPVILRPREKMIKNGAETLLLEELIAIIIGSGMRGKNAVEIGKEIVENLEQLSLESINIDSISKIKGVGMIKAMKIKAALELGLRIIENKSARPCIRSGADAYRILYEFVDKSQEHFILLTLNPGRFLISKKVLYVGTVDASLFHPREIFAEAINDGASMIIVAHNHPSGSLEPSENDLEMTVMIKRAGELMGINLMDSIIISEDGYRSIIN